MTQRELADKANMSRQYISDKIQNRGPRGMSLANAKTIAYILKCHIDDLYEWESLD